MVFVKLMQSAEVLRVRVPCEFGERGLDSVGAGSVEEARCFGRVDGNVRI